MPTTLEELVKTVLALPEEQRSELVDRVVESLPAHATHDERQWDDVAARRAEELRSGAVEGIPWEQVKAEATRLLDE